MVPPVAMPMMPGMRPGMPVMPGMVHGMRPPLMGNLKFFHSTSTLAPGMMPINAAMRIPMPRPGM